MKLGPQRRHVGPISSGVIFVIGMIAVGGEYVTSADPGVIGAIVAVSTVAASLHLAVWAARKAPYNLLKQIVLIGGAMAFVTSFLLSLLVFSMGYTEHTRQAIATLPAGDLVYDTLVGFVALLSFLFLPFLARVLVRNYREDGNDGGGGDTPEERILSDEELEQFDVPYEELSNSNDDKPSPEIG